VEVNRLVDTMKSSVCTLALVFIILLSAASAQEESYPENESPSTSTSTSTSEETMPAEMISTTTTTTTISEKARGTDRILVETTLTTLEPGTLDRRQLEREYMESLILGGMTITTTTASTCGGTNIYCSVEYDSTADGKPDCCTAENNPVCAGCLEHCVEYCARGFVGVATCFVDERAGPVCHCAKVSPSCYSIAFTPSTQQASEPPGKTSNNMVYMLVLSLIVVTFAAAVHFVYKTK